MGARLRRAPRRVRAEPAAACGTDGPEASRSWGRRGAEAGEREGAPPRSRGWEACGRRRVWSRAWSRPGRAGPGSPGEGSPAIRRDRVPPGSQLSFAPFSEPQRGPQSSEPPGGPGVPVLSPGEPSRPSSGPRCVTAPVQTSEVAEWPGTPPSPFPLFPQVPALGAWGALLPLL